MTQADLSPIRAALDAGEFVRAITKDVSGELVEHDDLGPLIMGRIPPREQLIRLRRRHRRCKAVRSSRDRGTAMSAPSKSLRRTISFQVIGAPARSPFKGRVSRHLRWSMAIPFTPARSPMLFLAHCTRTPTSLAHSPVIRAPNTSQPRSPRLPARVLVRIPDTLQSSDYSAGSLSVRQRAEILQVFLQPYASGYAITAHAR